MFNTGKSELVETLKYMREKHCCYVFSEKFCDCKYGYSKEKNYGEFTGCPELRDVINILSIMTDKEYDKFIKRWNESFNKGV